VRVSAIMLTEAIVEMVKAGIGVAALARWAVEPYVNSGALIPVRLGRDGLRRTWNAATLKSSATPLHIREFCRLLARGPLGLAAPAVAAGSIRA
jgi:LysR family transcriptional regulator for metE and metH